MKKGWELTSEAFEGLLRWLSPDRDEAALAYERIRNGLIRIFIVRGCVNSDALADETINRVSSKLPSIIEGYDGEPANYFYNVANKIHLESLSSRKRREEQFDEKIHDRAVDAGDTQDLAFDPSLIFLQKCLEEFSYDHRRLIINYFTPDTNKAEFRQKLADSAGINLNVLRIKILRLKKRLEACITLRSQSSSESFGEQLSL